MHVCWSATCMRILMRSVEGVRCPGAEFYGCWEPNQIRSILISCGQHLPQPLELCWGLDFCFCEVPAWPGYKAWKHGDVNTVRSLWPKGHGNQCVLPVLGGSFGDAFLSTQSFYFKGASSSMTHKLRLSQAQLGTSLEDTSWRHSLWPIEYEMSLMNLYVWTLGS